MQQMDSLERLYTLREIAKLWHIGPALVGRIFKDRAGVLNLSTPDRPSYRIPGSLVLEVMLERGYTHEQAEAVFRRPVTAA